jgi:hypothetical protein
MTDRCKVVVPTGSNKKFFFEIVINSKTETVTPNRGLANSKASRIYALIYEPDSTACGSGDQQDVGSVRQGRRPKGGPS